MTKYLAIAFLITGFLVSCGSGGGVVRIENWKTGDWQDGTGNLDKDSTQCLYEAHRSTASMAGGEVAGKVYERNHQYNLCMKARGWKPVAESKTTSILPR